MVLWATAFMSVAAILWVVVAKLASGSKEELSGEASSTQLDEVGNPNNLMTSTQHAVVTSK